MSLVRAFCPNNNQAHSVNSSHHQHQNQQQMMMNEEQQQQQGYRHQPNKKIQGRRTTINIYSIGAKWVEENKQLNNKQVINNNNTNTNNTKTTTKTKTTNSSVTKLLMSTKDLATPTIIDEDHHTDTNSDNGHELADTPKSSTPHNSTPELTPAQPRSRIIDNVIKNSKKINNDNNNDSSNVTIVHAIFVSKYHNLFATKDVVEYRYASITTPYKLQADQLNRPKDVPMCLVVVGQNLNPLFYQHGIEGMLAPIAMFLSPAGIRIYEPDFGKREKGLLSFYVRQDRLEEAPALLHGRLLFDVDRFFYAKTAQGLRAMNEYCDIVDCIKGSSSSSSRNNNNNNNRTDGPLIESFPHFAMTCVVHKFVFTQFRQQKRRYDAVLNKYNTRSNDAESWIFFEKWNTIAKSQELYQRDHHNNKNNQQVDDVSSSSSASTSLALDQKFLPKQQEIVRFHSVLETFLEQQQQQGMTTTIQNNYSYNTITHNNNFYSYGHQQHRQQHHQQMVPQPPPPPFVYPFQQQQH